MLQEKFNLTNYCSIITGAAQRLGEIGRHCNGEIWEGRRFNK